MFLPKPKDGPIQAGHNEDKRGAYNVWEKTSWNPEWSLEFDAVKLDWSKKVGQVESERKDQILQKKAFQIIT